MQEIEAHTGRWLIVYAANFRRSSPTAPNSIEERDLIGFSDLIDGATTNKLDVLVHSPGGSAEVTEQIVDLLRSKFDDIRFIVPHMAMSAATMLCLSGNAILMDERSALGPIDPQIRIPLPTGEVWLPAQVIIESLNEHSEPSLIILPCCQFTFRGYLSLDRMSKSVGTLWTFPKNWCKIGCVNSCLRARLMLPIKHKELLTISLTITFTSLTPGPSASIRSSLKALKCLICVKTKS
jgi:hypothetical protein